MPSKKPSKKKPTARKALNKTPAVKNKGRVKSTPARKKKAQSATKKTPPIEITRIIARTDIGFGNQLYIRGAGCGLSWDQGVPMENLAADLWAWTTQETTGEIKFKFLINDTHWSIGFNNVMSAGSTFQSTPVFTEFYLNY